MAKTYKVTVRLNNHKLSISKMRPHAFTLRSDKVAWYCPDARMKVDFGGGKGPSPFTWTSMDILQGDDTAYQVVNPVGITAYSLTIYHTDYEVVIDPEVDADGGDPGGMKKAAKKASRKKASRKSAGKRSKKARKK